MATFSKINKGATHMGGIVVQAVSTWDGTSSTGTTVMPADNTTPQITEGVEFTTLAITPTSVSNTLLIYALVHMENTGVGMRTIALFNTDSHATNALAVGNAYELTASRMTSQVLQHTMTAPSASSTTFSIRGGGETVGTTRFNKHNNGDFYNGLLRSGIVIMEIQV